MWFFLSLATISLGIDTLIEEHRLDAYKDKQVALLVNHTSTNQDHIATWERIHDIVPICAIFCPEHGFSGHRYAAEHVPSSEISSIPIYSLHGETRRPTAAMLEGIDVLFYDIQCTGVRAYTYPTTLFYMMEEAAKHNIEVVVLDRPNPINGTVVDGPLLEESWRSFIGYINVPYCHGMTIGELATYFNEEYHVGCRLTIIPMKGWKREMSYKDTGLPWIPPSPNVPEPDTPLYCPMTGILGELSLVNIGIGFTLPFKIVGAPWIVATQFAQKLNEQKLPGIYFQPFYFRPFWGLYKGLDCEGVLLQITNVATYRPLAVQYLLLGLLKSLYPHHVQPHLEKTSHNKDLFCKANGTSAIYDILLKEKYPAWKLLELYQADRDAFLEKRKKYLLY